MITRSMIPGIALHFPDGTCIQGDKSGIEISVGEKIITEGEEQIYIVVDIQHQFRRNEHGLMFMMTNVILKKTP